LLPLMPALALVLSWLLDQAEAINWQRSKLLMAIILGALGILFVLFPWPSELIVLTPILGLLLLLNAVLLGFSTPNNARELVGFVCISAIAAALTMSSGFFYAQGYRYDTGPPALKIAGLMAEKRAIAFFGSKYHGQYHFAGRLTESIALVPDHNKLLNFVKQNPTGFVLVEHKDPLSLPPLAVSYRYPFKSHLVSFISCQTLSANPQMIQILKGS
jgi:hypothetical protein